MIRAYKYRIYPNSNQIKLIDKTMSCCRFVYNLALETKMYAYKSGGIKLSRYELGRQLTDLKKDINWLSEVDSQCLYHVLKNLDSAFNNFFSGNAAYPKFKTKKLHNSFKCHGNSKKIDWINSTLTIPKIKNIPIVLSRKFNCQIKSVTIKKTQTDKYFASILVDDDFNEIKPDTVNPTMTIGIDVGIKSMAVTSDGRKFNQNRKLKDDLSRLVVLQKKAAKKIRNSRNHIKANKKIASLYEKIKNKRIDYIHKVTHELTNDSQIGTICVETLNIRGMLSNSKLSQSISDSSLGSFLNILKYKCRWYGKNFIKIGQFEPSSKLCSECGYIYANLKLSERVWTCPQCDTIHDRDINAAINIKLIGLKSRQGMSVETAELLSIDKAKKQ